MALILLLALAAAPDAGTSLTWKVTYTTSFGSDVGNGEISASGDTETVVTPTAVKLTAESMHKGKTTKNAWGPRPISAAVREAIAALLPKLPKESAAFSTSPYVNDEGWDSGGISYELGGKSVSFSLQQGKGDPVPPELTELLKLVTQASLVLKAPAKARP